MQVEHDPHIFWTVIVYILYKHELRFIGAHRSVTMFLRDDGPYTGETCRRL